MSLLTSTGRRFHIGWNRHLTSVSRLLFDMTDVKSLKNHHNYTQVIIQTKLLESLGMTTLLAFHDHYYQWTNFKNNQDTTSRITLMKWPRPDFLYVPDVLQKLQVQWPRPEDALIGWQENEEASEPENIEESVKVEWGQVVQKVQIKCKMHQLIVWDCGLESHEISNHFRHYWMCFRCLWMCKINIKLRTKREQTTSKSV
jgi:hypothetical protein